MKRAIRSKTVEIEVKFVFEAGRFPRPFVSKGRRLSVGAFECWMRRIALAELESKMLSWPTNGMFMPLVGDIEIYRGKERISELRQDPHA